jgi:ATP-dependent Clp protease ATP-binding subunit ClpA
MQIYQIHIPELHTGVKFKVVSTKEAEDFVQKHKRKSDENFKKEVLRYFIFNLKTDVASSLNMMSRAAAERAVEAMYAGCVMLNPGLDSDHWINMAYAGAPLNPIYDQDDDPFDEVRDFIKKTKQNIDKKNKEVVKSRKMTKHKFLGLANHLKSKVIGQDEAIEEVVSALTRAQADMHDENRPLGVFLFAGSSGVGKTHLASELHRYMFGGSSQMVRIDCGEFQHKHENQKLTGSPPGYVGHDEGGQLSNQVKNNPYTVVLLDEVEKAHQDIWNTFLRVFDEGVLTDSKGDLVSFRNTIIILTTNLGNDKIVNDMISTGAGFTQSVEFQRRTTTTPARATVKKKTEEAISKYFRPELLNRIDKTVIFNHLSREDCIRIAQIEMSVTADKLSRKGISLEYTDNVIDGLINLGIDTIRGARGISQVRRDSIETSLANMIVKSVVPKGTIFYIDYLDNEFSFNMTKPVKKKKVEEEG